MKSNKGITLMTLIIYIILLTLVLSMLAVINQMFFLNTNYLVESGKYVSEYNKFNMYFIEDVKNNKELYSIDSNKIVFKDGTTYTYNGDPDNGIYRNKVKICSNILSCKFSKTQKIVENVNKTIITVDVSINGSKIFKTSTQYVLRYW